MVQLRVATSSLRHVRVALIPPQPACLPDELRDELALASAALSSLGFVSPEAIDLAPDEHFRPLTHELSAHYRALHPAIRQRERSHAEASVLKDFETGSAPLSQFSPSGFRDQLAALNRVLTDGKGHWRTGFIKLADDQAGNQIYFPPVSAVPLQIERVRSLLAEPGDPPPLFTATVAYALLLNCHPFTDGNGRTARVVFNHLLRRAGMPGDVYLPLYEIARRSHGGYEIALRMAELRGDWTALLRWFLEALRCGRTIAANNRRGGS